MTDARNGSNKTLSYVLLVVLGFAMVYPLIWLVVSSFKTNADIFGSSSLFAGSYVTDSYAKGWAGTGQYGFKDFFLNTFVLVVPTVIFTIVSSVVVAYGFARFRFPLQTILFSLMMATLMLPDSTIMIPRYILFNKMGWLDTYLPFIVPAAFATSAFFVYMLIQFFRGLPRELDESAKIDGCNSFTILIRILLPLCKPAIFSVGIFQFIWTWNDFFNSIIYISSVKKFTVSLGLRMTLDASSAVSWNQVLAMSVVSIVPCIILFFMAQKYFVEGISTTGLKG
ncbi:sugar ABC transporter permease [Paenibacillus sp. MY03]|jgi:oligogalacturonide transport system permease protein|uniref:carbohydrate ABC transporter permease n=1 Tax=Paenibacillus sp. MY03 TaxID=302980 RepID=UPI000B3BE867|nr:carbohydrate ABC transporter permease [Paenibacillus sp. MY03]OUS74353.1 sugar ABC transporter permease [Paenibacillus sp. MY03]